MNKEQFEVIKLRKGFIAALDQSGGSTPKALLNYGIDSSKYHNDKEMFELIHKMRSRIMTNPAFTSEKILGAILFEATMYSEVDGLLSGDYLWDEKKIVPFLKIDKGLQSIENGVALMAPIEHMDKILEQAVEQNIFGTKMRSVIYENNDLGIKSIVEQQFEFAERIIAADLVPIIEPEVDIHAGDKAAIEVTLKNTLIKFLNQLEEGQWVMLKLTPPERDNFYSELVDHPNVLRVVFLSGGHSQEKANELLSRNKGVVASFSRALTEGLKVDQTEREFQEKLSDSISKIYQASIV